MPEFAVSLKIVGLSGVKTGESNPTARARLLGSATHLIPAANQSVNYSAATGVRAELFSTDSQRYLEETNDLIVCPTCLAEKPPQSVATSNIAGQEVHFCRCRYCPDLFQKDPDYYIKRLEGTIPYETGVAAHDGGSVKPE